MTEPQILLFLRRRFSLGELESLVTYIKELVENGETIDNAVYDGVRAFIKSGKFSDIDEYGDDDSYWRSYLTYEKPLVTFVKSQLGLE